MIRPRPTQLGFWPVWSRPVHNWCRANQSYSIMTLLCGISDGWLSPFQRPANQIRTDKCYIINLALLIWIHVAFDTCVCPKCRPAHNSIGFTYLTATKRLRERESEIERKRKRQQRNALFKNLARTSRLIEKFANHRINCCPFSITLGAAGWPKAEISLLNYFYICISQFAYYYKKHDSIFDRWIVLVKLAS